MAQWVSPLIVKKMPALLVDVGMAEVAAVAGLFKLGLACLGRQQPAQGDDCAPEETYAFCRHNWMWLRELRAEWRKTRVNFMNSHFILFNGIGGRLLQIACCVLEKCDGLDPYVNVQ